MDSPLLNLAFQLTPLISWTLLVVAFPILWVAQCANKKTPAPVSKSGVQPASIKVPTAPVAPVAKQEVKIEVKKVEEPKQPERKEPESPSPNKKTDDKKEEKK